MSLLVVIRPIRVKGRVADPGEVVRVHEGVATGLLSSGHARELDREESGRVVDAYVAEAARLFEVDVTAGGGR